MSFYFVFYLVLPVQHSVMTVIVLPKKGEF